MYIVRRNSKLGGVHCHLALGFRVGVVARELLLVALEGGLRHGVEVGVVDAGTSGNGASNFLVITSHPVVGVAIELVIAAKSVTGGAASRVALLRRISAESTRTATRVALNRVVHIIQELNGYFFTILRKLVALL
jgi:hypothetical protein